MSADRVRAIWCRELELQNVADEDDFFLLGGNSVTMARIQGAYLSELGIEVPADQMFLNTTLGGITDYIRSHPPASP